MENEQPPTITHYYVVRKTHLGWEKVCGYSHDTHAQALAWCAKNGYRDSVRIATCPPRDTGHGFTTLHASDLI